MKLEEIRSRYGDLPVAIERRGDIVVVKLRERVEREAFREYLRVSRELGGRYVPRLGGWAIPTRD